MKKKNDGLFRWGSVSDPSAGSGGFGSVSDPTVGGRMRSRKEIDDATSDSCDSDGRVLDKESDRG